MHYVIYIKPFSIHSYPQCVYRHWYPLCTEPFSCCAVSVLACACSTHEESCHMFQQVPVTRAPCFEALSLTVSPLENRGWLTCKQPCQGKTLKSLVGESAAEHYLHCDPWRTLSNSQREKSIWRGLQLQPRRANAIGHRADTSTFSMGGGGGGGTGTGGRISPAEPCVPLLGYVTGAGTWVVCWVWGEAWAKRTSCWDGRMMRRRSRTGWVARCKGVEKIKVTPQGNKET